MNQQVMALDSEYRAKADTLHLLFKQSLPAVAISLVNASLLVAALWQGVSHSKLLIWYMAIIVASAIRAFMFTAYRLRRPKADAVLAWEATYLMTLVFSSLVWGMGGLWLITVAATADQLIIFFFLIGMAGGAVSVYSALRPILLTTMAIVLVPSTLWFLLFGDMTTRIAAAGSSLFLISCLRSTKVLSTALHQSYLLSHELVSAKDRVERLARTDYLTQLNNRGAFHALAESQIENCKQHRLPLSLIMMDIDDFKMVNDTHGHIAGDNALRKVAEIIQKNTRASDVSGRIGGEEFAILLSATSAEQAGFVAEKIRAALAGSDIASDHATFKVTASFGVSSASYDLEKLFSMADGALYETKSSGKNRVCFSPLDPFGTLGKALLSRVV